VGITLQGRYQLQARVAEGAMGSVYRGERLGLQRAVAVKFLRADLARDPSFVQRFQAETRALGRLCHPNCVSVIDLGTTGGVPYVVMDFVPGESLRVELGGGPLLARRALGIVGQVLSALHHAHERGIVHRDIKPENILLERSAGLDGDHVRVLDFGLSKLLEETSEVTESMMVGTPCYMAPEQFRAGPVDPRADVYACGVLLYELLTGFNPFDGDSMNDTAVAHRFMSAPPPRFLRGGQRTSPALLQVLGRALAKDPDERFASAAAMKAAFDAVPELGVATTREPALLKLRTGARRSLATIRARLPVAARQSLATGRAAFALARKLTRAGNRRGLQAARAARTRLAPVLGRVLARCRSWLQVSQARRIGALVFGAFAIGFVVMFALTPSARTPQTAVALARPANSPTPSAVDTVLAMAREAFERQQYEDGLDFFRSAARHDPRARSNAVLCEHVIDGLANDELAPVAEAFLRELGPDARPHLESAARTHGDARVRKRARALLTQDPPRAGRTKPRQAA
jgi:serine/threonine-protein kinase